jgi:hypothetical protein
MISDKERAETYRSFLSRLYTYRNITSDQSRIQQWLSKLDNWGRAADDQMIDDEEWAAVMQTLREPELPS